MTAVADAKRSIEGQRGEMTWTRRRTMTQNPRVRRPGRPSGAQGAPAGRLVLGRLCRRRHDAADRRRGAVRGARPARGTEGARRRGRQRQRLARRRSPLVRGGRHRLRAGAARARPRARRRRAARHRVPRGRRRGAAVPERELRRRRLDLRRDVHARPGSRRGRDGPRLQARRQDRPRQLDARGLHRPGVQDHRQARPAAPGARSPALWGTRARIDELFEPHAASITTAQRNFVFRYRSPEHWLEVFRTYYGPVLKTFAALEPAAQPRSSAT